MGCILNYCSDHLPAALLIAALYGMAVLVTLGLAWLAHSRSIRTAASLIAIGWLFGIFAFFYLNIAGYYLIAVMFDAILAYYFWRMAKTEIFPAPLCVVLLFDIAFIVFAQAVGLTPFTTIFVLNRIFELTLLYLIGCSLFRIHIMRLQQKSEAPIGGWRVKFVVG